jgi:lipopolysaccharide transport protein LptA
LVAWNTLALALWAVAAPPSAAGRLARVGRPVELTAAGGLSLDLSRGVGLARGDVVVRRDDVTVCCDEAEARYASNRLERVTCRGRVEIVRADGTRARADVAVFVASEDRLTLSGQAEVLARDARLEGERIVYDLGTDRLEVEGGASRVRYRPEGASPAPLRPCPPRRGAKGARP